MKITTREEHEAAEARASEMIQNADYESRMKSPEFLELIEALKTSTSPWHTGKYWMTGGVVVGDAALHCSYGSDNLARLDVRRAVTCQTCGRCFEALMVSEDDEPVAGTQGSDCAGYIKNGVFMGAYGSCFDLEAIAIHGYTGPDVDPVCDYCVFNWMRAGRATYLGDVREGAEPSPYREMVHRVGSIMATWR